MDELTKVLESLEGRPTKEEVGDMISQVDFDGNGAIDFEEFLNVMARNMQGNVADELYEAFKVFDKDQNGYISANEVNVVYINAVLDTWLELVLIFVVGCVDAVETSDGEFGRENHGGRS